MLLRKLMYILVFIYLNILKISCDQGITIAFAIDDTRSMWDDIDQVKREAKNILDLAIAEKSSEIKDLVLVTINDPDVVLRTKTSSTYTLQQALNNIRVHNYGNTDCAEMALTGIEKALLASRPNSYIFVFTDASAKDYNKIDTIKYLCQKKQSQVILVLTGDCGYPSDSNFMVYHDIAAASSGQVFRVKKDQVHSVLDAIRELLKRKHSVVKWTTIPKTHSYVPVMFTLDEKAEYALVSTSGKNVYLRLTSTNHVYGPEPAFEKVMWNSNGKVLKLVNPTPGTYYAWVKGDSALSVVIYARTDFTFDHGFSTNEPKSLRDTTKQPVASKPQHLSINVTDPEHSVDIKSVHILDMDNNDHIIKTLPLRNTGDNFYITDAFVSPSRMFRIAVNGVIKKTGQPITRISKTAIEPMENVPNVEIAEGVALNVNYGASASLTCKVIAHPKPTIEWSAAGGNTLPSENYVIEGSSYGSRLKLENIKKTETYICKAENNKGIESSQTQITVRPVFNPISVPAATTTAIYGKDVKIQCNIQSYLPIKIRWYYQGKELSSTGKNSISADGTELTVKAEDLGIQGMYTCEASLISEPTMKETHNTEVKITGLVSPVIAPTNKKIQGTKGDKIEISCKIVKGYPKPHVQWYKKNGINFDVIPHVTGEVLTVPNTQFKHAGEYKCVAENDVGKESALFEVTLTSKPEITIPEMERIFPYGSNVVFTCKVETNPPPTIVWKNDKGTVLQAKVIKIADYEFTNQLKLQSIRKSAIYTCEATNSIGYTTEYVNITVSSPFDVKAEIGGDTEINYGTEKTLRCDIKSSQPMSIQWYLQKTDVKSSRTLIQSSDKNTISSDGTELKIKFMDLSMVGKYTCEAALKNDPEEKITYDTNVKIVGLISPVIAPTNKKIQATKGDKIELSCKIVKGYPKPHVQWYKKNGINFDVIPHVTGEVLTVPNTQFKHAGEYKCVAENDVGKESALFEVTLTSKPEITIPEMERIFPYGSNVVFTCKVETNPPPTIVWKNDKGTVLQAKVIKIADYEFTNQLKLQSIKKSAIYTCEATNSIGYTTEYVNITVSSPFDVKAEIGGDTEINYGTEKTLRCDIKSSHSMSIQWYLQKTDAKSSRTLIQSSDKNTISSDGTELKIKFMDLSMVGKYTCEAALKNDPEEKITFDTNVKIVGLIRPVIAPTNKKIQATKGDKIELSCKIVKGYPKPHVQWYKKNGINFDVIPHETGEVLTVPNTQFKHAGEYKCVAENDVGKESALFEVTLTSKPEITIPETQRIFPYGSDVVFTCKVETNPPPTIVWKNDKGTVLQTKVIKIADYEFINQLKLQSIKKSAIYTCEATNSIGHTTEYVSITVSSPFDIKTQIDGDTVINYATEKTLRCDIKSSQPMSIQWYLQKTDAKSSRTLIQSSDKNTISSDGTELKIKFMDLSMVGKYTCEASLKNDPEEKITYDTNVKIAGLISPVIAPTNKKIQATKGDKIELSCKILKGYPKPHVQWYKKNGINFDVIPHVTGEVLTVPNTQYKHAGEYKCVAVNGVGKESALFEVTLTSKPEITIPETERIFPYGSNVVFTCKVETNPQPTIVWKNDKGTVLQTKVIKIADYEFTNQLKLQSIKKSAIYTCEATNSIGHTTEYVSITVSSPFDVKTQIDGDAEINYGTEKTLRCDIKSSHPMSIQWYLQKTDAKSSRTLIQSSDKNTISSDGTELKIKFMDLNTVGKYTCEASLKNDPEEKITFDTNVKIVGLMKPVITHYSTVLKDKDFTAICRVKGVPKPTISWQFQQKGSDAFIGIPGSEEELHISQLRLKHSGVYKCVAKNVLGDVDHDFDLAVEEPPVIINKNTTYFGIEGDLMLTIPCNVTGFPDPVIVWKTEGKIIDKNSKYVTKENVLYISKPMKIDTKQFTCEAKNKLGTVEKLFYTEITDIFENDINYYGISHEIYVIQGKPINLKCNITNSETRSVRWYRNGQLELDQTGNTYVIKSGTVSHDGNYTCRVNTDKGSQSETFALNVGFLNFDNPLSKTVNWKEIDEILDCSVQAKPSATVEWLKDGQKVENLNDLEIIPVTDWGHYTCNASNKHGSIQKSFNVISSGCFITMNMGTQNRPLISSVSTPTWSNSLSNLDLKLNKHESVKFSCPANDKSSNEFKTLSGRKEIIAHCDKQDKFIVDGKTYRYPELQCKTKVEPLVLNTLEKCSHADAELIRVGFEVKGLLEAYTICYNKNKNVPVYVKAQRLPLFAGDVDSTKFKWTPAPGLGDGKPTGGYNCTSSRKCCYGKGQLLNATEIPFGPGQDAAFKENLNSVAVWHPCADSDRMPWESFVNEMLLKSYEYDRWTSWTGASDYASKNGGLVPRFLWKVMTHDEEISVMVYVNDEAPTDSDIRCTQICETMLDSDSQKYLYCCTPEEFSTAFNIDVKKLT